MYAPEVGTTCSYTFVTQFAKLNDIYTLRRKLLFETALDEKIDFASALYKPANVDTAQYTNDYSNYQGGLVLDLTSVNDPSLSIPVPISLLSLTPDPNIREYLDLYIALDLGYQSDLSDVSWVMDQLADLVSSVTGVQSDAQLYQSGTKWMSINEYQTLQQQRQANIKQITPTALALRNALIENAELKNKIVLYESVLKSLQKP